jgi:wobble nucleotide-excising tRNase
LEDLLSRGLDATTSATAEMVRRHVSDVLDTEGESWLAYGVEHAKNNRCPFCGQDTSSCEMVKAYADYFSKTYKQFLDETQAAAGSLEDALSTERRAAVVEVLLANARLWDFWKQHVSDTLPEVDRESLVRTWSLCAKMLSSLLSGKLSNPLVAVAIGEADRPALVAFEKLILELHAYNAALRQLNVAIVRVQKDASGGDTAREQTILHGLQNSQRRQKPDVAVLCQNYTDLANRKNRLTSKKQVLMGKLTRFSDGFSKTFEKRVNEKLSALGADFSIERASSKLVNFIGRKPNLDYRLRIRNVSVPLGAENTPDDVPSFKNTVSEGDKGTLAFALFLAKVDTLPDLADAVLVFDDPINSFDANRKYATVSELRRLAEQVNQSIVLTHDASFALQVWNSRPDVLPLYLRRDSTSQVIARWDIAADTASLYERDYRAVAAFVSADTGDRLAIVRSLRQLLEGNLRVRFVLEFPPGEWLGAMIKRIRNSSASSVLAPLKQPTRLRELEDINDYCKQYYHDDWSRTVETPSDTELRSYAQRTIVFCGG